MKDIKPKKAVIPVYPLKTPLIAGFLVGSAVCFLLLFVFAFLMTLKDVPEWALGLISASCSAAGALFGGITAAVIYKKRGIFIGAGIGLIIFTVIFIVGCFCGAEPFSLTRLASLAANVILGAAGGIIGVNTAAKRKF